MQIKIALAGNPNSGKTTLFNALTGSNQFVGNWPGVTVEKKEGKLKKHSNVVITDLPGIYSLSHYTLEDVVARNYHLKEIPDAIMNIFDGTNLERNLYLTTQLTELGIPVVVAVNMIDVVHKNGDRLNVEALSAAIGCPVVEISALKGTGISAAAEAAIKAAQSGSTLPQHSFSGPVEHALAHIEEVTVHDLPEEQQRWYAIKLFERDEKVSTQLQLSDSVKDHIEKDIQAVEKELDDDAESIITNERYVYIASIIKGCYKKKNTQKLSTSDKIDRVVTNRFAALPIFAVVMFLVYYISVSTVGTFATDWANDGVFGDGWHLFGIGSSAYEEAVTEYAEENVWTPAVLETVKQAADAKVVGAGDILSAIEAKDFGAFEEAYGSYAASLDNEGYIISEAVDASLENAPDTADYGVWVPGIPVLVERGLTAVHCADWLQGLILDGIVGGVGAVLGFVPQMLVLFFLLAFLESCGYMARIAFVLDRIFRKFGLSGKSFIPMLIGTGCGVPGVMASRTIENDRDRKMTIMTTTFIPCSAKLPIIALIASALFGGAWWVAPSAYFLGIAAIIVSGIILKKTKMFAGDPAPFVMELPPYRIPTGKAIARHMWGKAEQYLRKMGGVILIASIAIWALSYYPHPDSQQELTAQQRTEQQANSYLGRLGRFISPVMEPLGFNWKVSVALISGTAAKELVVSTLGVLYSENDSDETLTLSQRISQPNPATGTPDFTPLVALTFMVFVLLYFPCIASVVAVIKESGSWKWGAFTVIYNTCVAWIVAFIVYQIGSLFI